MTNFVLKSIRGETATADRFRALLAGEYMDSGSAQGGNALDALLPAFGNSHCSVEWLDDRPNHSAAWTTADAMAALNRAPLLVAHFGHGVDYGSDTSVMRTDDLGNWGDATVLSGIAATPPMNTHTDHVSSAERAFYRIQANK